MSQAKVMNSERRATSYVVRRSMFKAVGFAGLLWHTALPLPAAVIDGEAVYYYDGGTRIDLTLALDELRLEGNAGQDLDSANLPQRSAEVIKGAPIRMGLTWLGLTLFQPQTGPSC